MDIRIEYIDTKVSNTYRLVGHEGKFAVILDHTVVEICTTREAAQEVITAWDGWHGI